MSLRHNLPPARHALIVIAFALLASCTGASGPDDARDIGDAPGSTSQPASTTIAPPPTVALEPDPGATEEVALVGTTQLALGSIIRLQSQNCQSPVVRIDAMHHGSAEKYFAVSTEPRELRMRIPSDLMPGTYALSVTCHGSLDVPGPTHRLEVEVEVEVEEGDHEGDVDPATILDVDPNRVCMFFAENENGRRSACEERARFPEWVWWMNDDSHGPALTKADVVGLLESLWVDTPVSVSRTEWRTFPLYPDESFVLLDGIDLDPESGMRWVYSDHGQVGERMMADLPTLIADSTSTQPEEFGLASYLGLALASSIGHAYVIDGTTMWLPASARARYERLQFESLALFRDGQALSPEEHQELAAIESALPDPRDWEGRWILNNTANELWGYPTGATSIPKLTDVAAVLVEAGFISAEIRDGGVHNVEFDPGVLVVQVERDWYVAELELRLSASSDVVAIVKVNTELNQISDLRLGPMQLYLVPTDLSRRTVPEESDVLTIEETAAWLGIKPECLRPEDSVVNPPESLPDWCIS